MSAVADSSLLCCCCCCCFSLFVKWHNFLLTFVGWCSASNINPINVAVNQFLNCFFFFRVYAPCKCKKQTNNQHKQCRYSFMHSSDATCAIMFNLCQEKKLYSTFFCCCKFSFTLFVLLLICVMYFIFQCSVSATLSLECHYHCTTK